MKFHHIASWILSALNALMLVFLFLGDRMVFPAWILAIGRMHPLLLHLPIGATVLALLVLPFRKQFDKEPFDRLYSLLLAVAALTASLTALMGLILAGEGGYSEDTLNAHRISGAMFAIVVTILYTGFGKDFLREKVFYAAIVPCVVLLLVAGHFGSVLTHGDDFVFEPLTRSKDAKMREVTDSTSLFTAVIEPILEQKCTSCHNERKSKGDLVLTTASGRAKGGEQGALWNPGNPQSSLLMKVVLLPEDHDDHMPPKGKAQLLASEVQLLFQWILSGADTTKAWTKYDPADSVRKIAEQLIRSSANASSGPKYRFEPASPEEIKRLNDPYRTVAPVALSEPALAATFFIQSEYKSSKLEELLAVKDQLVSLNLSGMPVTDEDCKTISKLSRLEKLNLNFTSVSGQGLQLLASIPELKQLSIAGTPIDALAAKELNSYPGLKEVFVWNTRLSNDDIAALRSQAPGIDWNTGYVPDPRERLRLTPPIPVSDKAIYEQGEPVALTHKLPGTVIRYTTDGTDPDSLNGKRYEEPFEINGYTIVKTRACKDGWFCSGVGTFVLYTKGVDPLSTKLLTQPNKDYKGEGAATLSNNRKGFTDDHRDIAWIGFRENPMSAEFRFKPGTTIRSITVSYDRNTGSWLFPPSKLEVWAGKDADHLNLLSTVKPDQPSRMEPTRNDALVLPVGGDGFELYKIVAYSLEQLPKWHPANNPKTKDKRAWFFVDEIIFQ